MTRYEGGVATSLEQVLLDYLATQEASDSAHDRGHLRRVLSTARSIACEGEHDSQVLTAAALLHDLVSLPKNHPDRVRASTMSANAAVELLQDLCPGQFSDTQLESVWHAIHAHSYSADVRPLTLEACAIQDADRMDALGYVGIARCFAVSGALGRALFDPADPLAESRPLDERRWALDHFQTKLLKLPDTMTTEMGREIGRRKADVMRRFMTALAEEACPGPEMQHAEASISL